MLMARRVGILVWYRRQVPSEGISTDGTKPLTNQSPYSFDCAFGITCIWLCSLYEIYSSTQIKLQNVTRGCIVAKLRVRSWKQQTRGRIYYILAQGPWDVYS